MYNFDTLLLTQVIWEKLAKIDLFQKKLELSLNDPYLQTTLYCFATYISKILKVKYVSVKLQLRSKSIILEYIFF